MNSLSWMLYIIDIAARFSLIIGPLLAITAILVLLPLAVCHFFYEEYYDYNESGHRIYQRKYPGRHISWHGRWVFPIWFLLFFMILFIPSKETMLMIAASQIGEQIIQLEEVQKIGGDVGGLASDTIELLRQNIQEQLTKPVEAD